MPGIVPAGFLGATCVTAKRRKSGRPSLVAMVEPADLAKRDHVPVGDRLHGSSDRRILPCAGPSASPPRAAQQQPKQSISSVDGWPRIRAREHRQLFPERPVLKRDRAMSAADQGQRPKQKENRSPMSACAIPWLHALADVRVVELTCGRVGGPGLRIWAAGHRSGWIPPDAPCLLSCGKQVALEGSSAERLVATEKCLEAETLKAIIQSLEGVCPMLAVLNSRAGIYVSGFISGAVALFIASTCNRAVGCKPLRR